MADEQRAIKHKLSIEARESIYITGVTDVISFDEEQVVADTELGELVIKGYNLHVNNLNLVSGHLEIFGEIVSVAYEQEVKGKQKSSLFAKIFK